MVRLLGAVIYSAGPFSDDQMGMDTCWDHVSAYEGERPGLAIDFSAAIGKEVSDADLIEHCERAGDWPR